MRAANLAVFRDHGVDPIFRGDAHEILGLQTVARQRQRMRHQPGILQALVHRPQVVLRAAEAMDQKHPIRRLL